MSFGFSVSDFVGLARTAYTIYFELRQAPKSCEAFRREILLFHEVLSRTASILEDKALLISDQDRQSLDTCAQSCEELLYVKIYGDTSLLRRDQCDDAIGSSGPGLLSLPSEHKIYNMCKWFPEHKTYNMCEGFRGWRRTWNTRKFAAAIPSLQQAVAAHTQSLTALLNLITWYAPKSRPKCKQGLTYMWISSSALASQYRLEVSMEVSRLDRVFTTDYIQGVYVSAEGSRNRLEAASQRLEKNQNRMEEQLKSILESQRRNEDHVMSHSLDASSPEGRETWMNLGRLLRAEGITPALIKQNRDILVRAMKSTLQEDLSSSIPESYHTAFESLPPGDRDFGTTNLIPRRPKMSESLSMSLFGSAPPRSATFTDDFLERHGRVTASLDQQENVEDGMQSLLQGMNKSEEDEDETADAVNEGEMGMSILDL